MLLRMSKTIFFGGGEQKPGKQGWAMTLNDRRESHQEGNGRLESHYDYAWEEKKHDRWSGSKFDTHCSNAQGA
jgi:hypothetical protein